MCAKVRFEAAFVFLEQRTGTAVAAKRNRNRHSDQRRGWNKGCGLDSMAKKKAVSYTHLDVYKRQVQTGDGSAVVAQDPALAVHHQAAHGCLRKALAVDGVVGTMAGDGHQLSLIHILIPTKKWLRFRNWHHASVKSVPLV